LLKASLVAVLDRKQVNVAATKLEEWISWASRSQLEPFRRVARCPDKARTRGGTWRGGSVCTDRAAKQRCLVNRSERIRVGRET